jgi:integrase
VEDADIGANPAQSVRYVPSEDARRRHHKPPPKDLTIKDIVAILQAMPEAWRAFFLLLAHTGVRISELLGLTWANVHLGDDPHIMVVEQVYRGQRKPKLKTDRSLASVPLSPEMASWLADLRSQDTAPDDPVFPSSTGTPLTYSNVYNRVLRPALVKSGIAVKVGEGENGPTYDYQRVGFHRFRHACGSLLHANGKTLAQTQGWLRHSQLSTTLDVYTHPVDDGLGSADVWDEILPASAIRGELGATSGQPDPRDQPQTGPSREPAKRRPRAKSANSRE